LLTSGAGADIMYGDDGNDTIYGDENNDQIYGGNDNDTMYGEEGNDTLTDGIGTDAFSGGTGADTFVFVSGSLATAADTIADSSAGGGDKIDLRNLLGSYDSGQDAIDDFVRFTTGGGNTVISIDAAGGGSSYTNLVTLTGVRVTDTVEDMVAAGRLLVA
jgi:large repetitive protein